MSSGTMRLLFMGLAFWVSLAVTRTASAQTFGVELHNNLMPASGGMGGVSIANPQDLTSAINANPATLSRFRGTQFLFGGAWAEPTFNFTQDQQLPLLGVEPFSAKSTAPGVPLGNIGVSQDLEELGIPATLAIGFVTTSGLFGDFRHVPESNGTNVGLTIFSLPVSLGVDLTDRWSVGTSLSMGIAFFDGPFVGVGGMTPDYALRGTIGTNYRLTERTAIGGYYQTKQSFQFDNAFKFGLGPFEAARDINMDLPENLGIGVANQSLMDGRLLLGVDLLYKLWSDTDLYGAVYNNQWAVQTGGQYSVGRWRLRLGYTWAQNPINPNSSSVNIGGIPVGSVPAIAYTQGLVAVTSQHRISGGIGIVDVLPGIDFNMMAGGMLPDTQQLGQFTTTNIQSYWLGFGLTWRFGRGACGDVSVPNQWN
ncbi:OmpP1/FadL family transporter [Pirellulaceae bacterium SH449]